MLTYNQCLNMKFRNGIKKLKSNTYLIKRGENFAVRYHNTDILTICPTGEYILDNGGWQTVTTKARLNDFGPVRIYQKKDVWYIGEGIEFFNGMRVIGSSL